MKIHLSEQNYQDICNLLKSMIDNNVEGSIEILFSPSWNKKNSEKVISPIDSTPRIHGLLLVPSPDLMFPMQNPIINEGSKLVGAWGMFNTFFSSKAILRILLNLMERENIDSLSLKELMDSAIEAFNVSGFSKYRGFPSSNKPTSKKRIVSHYLSTVHQMGWFSAMENGNEITSIDSINAERWPNIELAPSSTGFQFARLPNRVLDYNEKEQTLTREEKQWLMIELSRLDELGYKEYSFLKTLYDYLELENRKNFEIASFIKDNEQFIDYVKMWSSKYQKGDIDGFNSQIENLSIMFMTGKIALLREMGLVSNKRNDYRIIGEWIHE